MLIVAVAHPFLPFGISTPYNRPVNVIDGPSLGALSALGSALTSVSTSAFLLLAVSIVVASSLGDTVFFESSQRVGVAPALTISMTYPLMAAVFAAAFLGEPAPIHTALGSLLT